MTSAQKPISNNLRNLHLVVTTAGNTATIYVAAAREKHSEELSIAATIGNSLQRGLEFLVENMGLETAAQNFTGIWQYLPVTIYSLAKIALVCNSVMALKAERQDKTTKS